MYSSCTEPRVVYVAGSTRSGSTLLESEIAQAIGGVGVGEVRFALERGLVRNDLCSCGSPFGICPFWREVTHECRRHGQTLVSGHIPALNSMIRTRRLLEYRHPSSLTRSVTFRMIAPVIRSLYRSISDVSGGAIIIDSSKDPMYLRLLQASGVTRMLTIHLTRDSRAVAHSWGRRRIRPEVVGATEYMASITAAAAAREWDRVNVLTEWHRGRESVWVRYEDFARDPKATMDRVSCVIGSLGWEPSRRQSRSWHSVAGNPVRFQHQCAVNVDDEWKRTMPRKQRAVVTMLTAPLLHRYGYPIP